MKTLLRLLLLLLASGIAAGTLDAQGSQGIIRGTVTDSTSGAAIPFANIRVEGGNIGAACDAKGYYVLPSLPVGRYKLTASIVGYLPAAKSVNVAAVGITLCDFHLTPSPVQLGTVERLGERRESHAETNVSIETVGQREFELTPVAVQPDIFRTLMALPGVQSTSDVSTQFYVRGGGGDQNLIYFDGMPVYNPFHALGLFSIFDASSIRSAELFKGGFGAEFGGRLSSVLNIVTREGNKKRFGGNAGMGLASGRLLVEGPFAWEGSSWLIGARKSLFGRVLNQFVDTKNYPFDYYDVTGNLDLHIGENSRLAVHSFFSGDRLDNSSPQQPNYNWYNNAIGANLRQIFLEGQFYGDFSLAFSTFSASLDPKLHPALKPQTSSVADRMLRADATYVLGTGDQIGFGVLFHIVDVGYSLVNSANIPLSNSDILPEGVLYWKLKYLRIPNLTTEAGLRVNYIDLLDEAHAAFEPRLSFRYHVSPLLAVKGAFGTYHQRLITLSNEDNLINLFEMWYPLLSSSRVPAEEAEHYVVGVEATFSPALDATLELYTKPMKVLFGYNLNKVDQHDPDLIQGTGSASGVELLLRYQTPALRGWVSYSYSTTSRTFNGITYPPRYDRRHTLHAIASWSFAEGWELGTQWEFGSGLPFTPMTGYYDRVPFDGMPDGPGYVAERGIPYMLLGTKNSERFPPYHRLDMSMRKRLKIADLKVVISGNIVNVYNRKNIFYFDRATGARVNMLPFLPSADVSVEF